MCIYLLCSVLVVKNLGEDVYESFLDYMYVVDRCIIIRIYFKYGLGVGIMNEKLFEVLCERYGG